MEKDPKEQFQSLTPKKRIGYIWDYYKLPIIIGLIFLYIGGYLIFRTVTKKDTYLYAASINVSFGNEIKKDLTDGFMKDAGIDPRHKQVFFTGSLVLGSEKESDSQYSYASRMKIVAMVETQELDTVIMSKSAYDLMESSGYLADLSGVADLKEGGLTSAQDALVLTGNGGIFKDSGIKDDLYLGIIVNTKRRSAAEQYLRYLSAHK